MKIQSSNMKLRARGSLHWFTRLVILLWSILPLSMVAQDTWICNGRYAYAYHCTPSCPGLNNCRGGISMVKLSYAKTIRSKCQKCGGLCGDGVGIANVGDENFEKMLSELATLSEQLEAVQQQVERLQSDSVLQSHNLHDLRLQIRRLQRVLDSITVVRKTESVSLRAAVEAASGSKRHYDSLATLNARTTAEQLMINQTVQPERLSFELCLGAESHLAAKGSNHGSFTVESGLLYRFDVDPYNVVQTPRRGNRAGVQYAYCHEFVHWLNDPNAGFHHELAGVLEFREWFRVGVGAVLGRQNSSFLQELDRYLSVQICFTRYPLPVRMGVSVYSSQDFSKTQFSLSVNMGFGFNFLRL